MTSNDKLVATLRRMADDIEKSPALHCWKASASARDLASVGIQPLDAHRGAHRGAHGAQMNYAIFIGAPDFVDAAPSLYEGMQVTAPKKSKGKK